MRRLSRLALLALALTLCAHANADPQEKRYCAGFTAMVMAGLPSTVREQYAATAAVPIEKVIPGDLIYFGKIGERYR